MTTLCTTQNMRKVNCIASHNINKRVEFCIAEGQEM